jgi:hypothetical protein
MNSSRTHRILLAASGLIAFGIGAAILVAPAAFHASYGTDLGTNANLLSEIRAPGGALMVLGAMMLIGVFAPAFTLASTAIAATVYLAYGLSRLLSMALDGMPGEGLLTATAFELVLGFACTVVLVRSARRARLEVQAA